jgi:phosphoribosylanthranilate isomerase
MTRVKICGITNHEDAEAAVGAGADALGFIFARSPRQVDVDTVRAICERVPLFVSTVGVFVNEPRERVEAVVAECGLTAVQLHADERPPDWDRVGRAAVIRALRVRDEASLALIDEYEGGVFLIEAYAEDRHGGTGKVLDLDLARRAVATGRTIMLAGGLDPDNVHDIVCEVRPFAVDVSGGVEASPGKKDHQRIIDFIAAVHEADRSAPPRRPVPPLD